MRVALVLEEAKRHSYARTEHMLADQVSILAKQNEHLFYMKDAVDKNGVAAVDFVVVDSPLLLSAYYAPPDYPKSFTPFVFDLFNGYDNLNFYLDRTHPYDDAGRYHTESESDRVALEMPLLLDAHGIPYTRIPSGDHVPLMILETLLQEHCHDFSPA